MKLKAGDIVNIDGVDWEIDYASPLGYWIKDPGNTPTYFGIRFETKEEFQKLADSGRLRVGKGEPITQGTRYCSWHEWKKYVGIKEVYDFCVNCGAKRHKDWRMIRDEKDY